MHLATKYSSLLVTRAAHEAQLQRVVEKFHDLKKSVYSGPESTHSLSLTSSCPKLQSYVEY